MGFLVKWVGVVVLASLVYVMLCRTGAGHITFDVGGATLSIAAICGWLAFFMGAGVGIKS
jgi:hypothetical protein